MLQHIDTALLRVNLCRDFAGIRRSGWQNINGANILAPRDYSLHTGGVAGSIPAAPTIITL
jgi:hypothetical protein